MKDRVASSWAGRAIALASIILLCSWTGSYAQTTTGSIRGYVRGTDGQPVAGATVTAVNPATNQQRGAITSETGFYLLPGLRPASYNLSVQMIGTAQQTRQVQVLVGQTQDVNFDLAAQAVAIEGLVVTAAPAAESRTSEVATNVTQEQIDGLPSSDRNFLSLAILAPGTQLQGDRLDGTRKTFTAGAQAAEQVNVFIDGASYKNDILQGGVAGQDASRGSPFPRNAVREFRVITQNFKAEYQKASSAIITATTQSGTNEWQGSAFVSYQNQELIALDTFQLKDRAANPTTFTRPDFKRTQLGLSVGGPVVQDRLHFFASYEGNDQNRARRVAITGVPAAPALDTINFASRNGEFDEPFRSTMIFGKLSYEHRANSFFELSHNLRHENDIRDFGGLTPFESATRFKNDVNTSILKHTWTRGSTLNEATASFQRYHYNPTPNAPGTVNRFFGFGCCVQLGSNISEQDFQQDRLALRNDLTWSGLRAAGEHVIKVGANVDFLNYDIVKRNAENPRFVYEPWFFNFSQPQRVEFQTGDPNFGTSNRQVGLYVQDDWSPTERLVLNLGVRWDYESAMVDRDYVTPRAVRDSVTKYQNLLFIPLDPERHFTSGKSDRDPFYGAIQPRLGFSYALDRNAKTTVFGGWGIFYDRMVFDIAIEEAFALQHPSYRIEFADPGQPASGNRAAWDPRFLTDPALVVSTLTQNRAFNTPEVKIIPNDVRPPKATHINVGLRRLFGDIATSVAYTNVQSENIFTFYFANMNFTCTPRTFACFRENRIPGFGTILMGDDAGKTWYKALQLKVDRTYRRTRENFGWGAGLAYSYSKRETEGFNDLFSFPNPADYPRQVRNDEPHRVVANWIVDVPFAWGIQFSGLVNLGSGQRFDVGDRFGTNFEAGGFEPDKRSFIVPRAFAFRNVDLRLRKDFLQVSGNHVGVTAEVFNVFNYQNLGCYNVGNPDDANFGNANCVVSDPRRLQLSLQYDR